VCEGVGRSDIVCGESRLSGGLVAVGLTSAGVVGNSFDLARSVVRRFD